MAIIPLLNPPLARWLAGLSLVLALPVEAAEAYDPGRVGRIVDLRGDVALYDEQYGEWSDAQRNRPLVAGDRLVLQRSARAEVRVGDTVLLLGQGADVAIDALDDDRLRLTLYDGSLALRQLSRGVTEVDGETVEKGESVALKAGSVIRLSRVLTLTLVAEEPGTAVANATVIPRF